LMFLASWLSNIITKLIILSSWFLKIESDLVRNVIIQVAPWSLIIITLMIFWRVYGRIFRAAVRINIATVTR
jgi:hypothetical protein